VAIREPDVTIEDEGDECLFRPQNDWARQYLATHSYARATCRDGVLVVKARDVRDVAERLLDASFALGATSRELLPEDDGIRANAHGAALNVTDDRARSQAGGLQSALVYVFVIGAALIAGLFIGTLADWLIKYAGLGASAR
jgi:hypothetical protein